MTLVGAIRPDQHNGDVNYQQLIDDAVVAARTRLGHGRVADYIPALACADPNAVGMALATVDGAVFQAGDAEAPFSIQSISKLFTLALVLAEGGDALWRRVGREPSGNPFNSLVQLETEHGIPRNPFINAGAIVVTDRLHDLTGDAAERVRQFLRAESENPALATMLDRRVGSRARTPQCGAGPLHRQSRQPRQRRGNRAGAVLRALRDRGQLP